MDKLRIDKWLWAARIYKTRALAAKAVSGGHVHLNNARIKPSREIQVGDQLEINKTPYKFIITVLVLSGRRGPASEAQKLYAEDAESIQARELLTEQRRILAATTPRTERRPDKRDRRRIIRFINKNSVGDN
ncbi:MAG: RNA-binding S4 domain-containing protein [Gammaproteobacteria bacterium]|nr:RNA-binding S4 domain-containing protein [Gammaproteobacteria bacterium]MDH5777624.1 RNA-binding S4 domain-containing protein [Gammaproteobacteria bacterium]